MLDVDDVPDRQGCRADPRKAPAGNTSGEGETGIVRGRAVPGVVVGHHETARPDAKASTTTCTC